MTRNYTIYVDESGKNHLRKVDPINPYFVVSSVIVNNQIKKKIYTHAEKIKFKYWGHANGVNFHVNEMRRRVGPYKIFDPSNNPTLTMSDFEKDFANLVTHSGLQVGAVVVNKLKYIEKNPQVKHAIKKASSKKDSKWIDLIRGTEGRMTKEVAEHILMMYLHVLILRNATGQVVIEASDIIQDNLFFEMYNQLMHTGCMKMNLSSTDVRKRLTGVSFVTKKNFDIETELADASAYYLRQEAKRIDGLGSITSGSFEEKMIDVFKRKTFEYPDCLSGVTQNSFLKAY